MVTQTVPCIGSCCLIIQNSCYLVYSGSTLVLPAWHVVVDASSKVALHCHALYYIPGPRYRLHVDADNNWTPSLPLYSATDVARCRGGDVSRVSLKYDAAESSPVLGCWARNGIPLLVPGRHRMLTSVCEHGMVPLLVPGVFHQLVCSCRHTCSSETHGTIPTSLLVIVEMFLLPLYTRDSGISSKAAFLYVDTSNLVLVLLHLFDTRLDWLQSSLLVKVLCLRPSILL